jgi:hypothetical protein
VYEALQELEAQGLEDRKIKDQLSANPNFRAHYLILYDMVSHLVDANQAKVSVLATTTRRSISTDLIKRTHFIHPLLASTLRPVF